MKPLPVPVLTSWQQEFVDQFILQRHSKTLLIAAAGTGKTRTSLIAAKKMLEAKLVDSLLVISDRIDLREQWKYVANDHDISLQTSTESLLSQHGASLTLQSLQRKEMEATIDSAAKERRWLIIADDQRYETKSLSVLVDRMLDQNDGSRALYISRCVPSHFSFEAEFRFKTEFILEREILDLPSTEIHVARFAPSFSLLRQLQRGTTSVDNMSWRDFERLIAALLEKDGYTVELTQGSKDGGVDVIAIKDLGPTGYFKALWQAKKQSQTNKVGISVVRELADTRQEFGASKGIIVTSSYLTRGALERIDRDKYLLGKVDREDLDAWIKRTLYGGRGI